MFFASGVFYYFLTEQVKALVQKMADAFPSGVLVFDAANRTAVKMIAKTWLKSAKIKDVGAYFAVSDAPKEIGAWDSRLQVSSRGYMLGYNDLRDPSVSGFFRFLAKIGDGMMLGVSVHTVEEALKAVENGADCLGVGAMFSTSTKANADVLPKETLRDICAAVDIPVVAIGGISESNIMQLSGTGVDGVALVSAIFGAEDIESECRTLKALSENMVRA